MAAILLDDIHIGYGSRTLFHASTRFEQGELCALVGRNGSGKSSLLRVIAGLDTPLSGSVSLCGIDNSRITAGKRACIVGVVSTVRVSATNLRVRDVVCLGRTPHTNWLGNLSSDDMVIVGRAMERTGVSEFADKLIDTLSDGERARVMVARVVAQDTPIVLLDEPTAYLDIAGKMELCKLLRSLADEGKTVLFSSHDLATLWSIGANIALIEGGELHHSDFENTRHSAAMTRFLRDAGFDETFFSAHRGGKE